MPKAQDILRAIEIAQEAVGALPVEVPVGAQPMWTDFGLGTFGAFGRVALANPQRLQEQVVVQWPWQISMPWCCRPHGGTVICCDIGTVTVDFDGTSPELGSPWADRQLTVEVVMNGRRNTIDFEGKQEVGFPCSPGYCFEIPSGTWYRVRSLNQSKAIYHDTYCAEAGEDPSGFVDYLFCDPNIRLIGGDVEQDAPNVTVSLDSLGFVQVRHHLLERG